MELNEPITLSYQEKQYVCTLLDNNTLQRGLLQGVRVNFQLSMVGSFRLHLTLIPAILGLLSTNQQAPPTYQLSSISINFQFDETSDCIGRFQTNPSSFFQVNKLTQSTFYMLQRQSGNQPAETYTSQDTKTILKGDISLLIAQLQNLIHYLKLQQLNCYQVMQRINDSNLNPAALRNS